MSEQPKSPTHYRLMSTLKAVSYTHLTLPTSRWV